jgi:hypothetical protein
LTSLSVTGNVSAGNVSGTLLTGNVSSSGTSGFSTATFSTLANVTSSTASTSTTTGALIVAGGAGIAGNINAGGAAIRFTGGTASTSNATGTVVITGGLGVSGNIWAGQNNANYADLAENYRADAQYQPGTVVEFGGPAEITVAEAETHRVAGVVSTVPGYLMNSNLVSEYVVAVAFTGRVPTKVRGPVRKGDLMSSAGDGYAHAATQPKFGSIIGKALEDFDGDEGVIEVVVGRY